MARQRISLRTGTYLTYNIKRGNKSEATRKLEDVEYIRPEGNDEFLAISLRTGVTALGKTDEEAYSWLIFKLYSYLRDTIYDKEEDVEIGPEVSFELQEETVQAPRMPIERQKRALRKGMKEFKRVHEDDGVRIDYQLTTTNLADTDYSLNVVVNDTEPVQA